MSRDFEYCSSNNQFSILLSQLRRHLTPSEFRMLVSLQRASQEWVERNLFSPRFEDLWLAQMNRHIDREFERMKVARLQSYRVRPLVHLLQHLFLGEGKLAE